MGILDNLEEWIEFEDDQEKAGDEDDQSNQ